MRWLTDPVTRSTLRRSLSWVRLLPLVPAVFVELNQPARGRPLRIAAMAFCFAAPAAAASFLEAEHNGWLDQLRLSGLASTRVARNLFAPGLVWLAVAAAALVWALAAGPVPLPALLIILTMTSVTTAAALIACTALTVRDQIDPRISTVALGIAAVTIGVAATGLLRDMPPSRYVALGLAAVLVIIAERARHLPARLAYRTRTGQNLSPAFRPPSYEWLLDRPGFYRGWCLSASGLVLLTIIAPTLILAWWLRETPYRGDTAPMYAAPLLIGLIAISLICREDVTRGRLDVVRQSSRKAWLAALEMIAGLWFPFALAAAGLAVVTWLLFGVSLQGLQGLAVIALVLVPLPAIEGWSTLWPLMTTVPFTIAMLASRGADAILSLVVLVWLAWYAAIRLFENPSRPVLEGVTAIVVPALICGGPAFGGMIGFDPITVATAISGILFLTSQVLIDPESTNDVRWGQPLAICVVVLFTFGAAAGQVLGLWAAAVMFITWYCAYRIRQIRPERPALQAGIRIAMLVGVAQLEAMRFELHAAWPGFWEPARLLANVTAAAVLSEIGYRVSTLSGRKTALAIPRP